MPCYNTQEPFQLRRRFVTLIILRTSILLSAICLILVPFQHAAFAAEPEITGLACCPTGIRVPPVRELIDRVTLVTVHAFMDHSNFDVERVSKCCVTEVLPDGRMVPFCVYNNLQRHGGC